VAEAPASITEIALPDDEPEIEEPLYPAVHDGKWPESFLGDDRRLPLEGVGLLGVWFGKPSANEHESG
jgi:hypothetical protein